MNNHLQNVLAVVCAWLALGLPGEANGGPHHFQKWVEGRIVVTDVQSRQFTLHTGISSPDARFEWGSSTRLFDGAGRKPVLAAANPGMLQTGTTVRVLYRSHAGKALAERILLQPHPRPAVATR